MSPKPRRSIKPEEQPLSWKEFRQKISDYCNNVYEPIATEMLYNRNSRDFDVFHDFTHICRDALFHDRKPAENTKQRLLTWCANSEEELKELKPTTQYPKVYEATVALLPLIKTQLERRKVPDLGAQR